MSSHETVNNKVLIPRIRTLRDLLSIPLYTHNKDAIFSLKDSFSNFVRLSDERNTERMLDMNLGKLNQYIPHELALGFPCREEFEKP